MSHRPPKRLFGSPRPTGEKARRLYSEVAREERRLRRERPGYDGPEDGAAAAVKPRPTPEERKAGEARLARDLPAHWADAETPAERAARAEQAAAEITSAALPPSMDAAFTRALIQGVLPRCEAARNYLISAAAAATVETVGAAKAAAEQGHAVCAAVQRSANLASMPADVRAAIGMSNIRPVTLYDAARADWLSLRAHLPVATADEIEQEHPITRRPTRVEQLVAAAQVYAAQAERAAGTPVDLLALADPPTICDMPPSSPAPAPVRPPAGYMDYPGVRAADAIEADSTDAAEDTAAATSGTKHVIGRIRAGHFAGLYFGDWRMPGNGAPDRTCGQYHRLKGCTDDRHAAKGVPLAAAKRVPHTCGRLDCPICFESVIDRMAGRIVERWDGFAALRRSDLYDLAPHRRLPLHITLSLPVSLYGQASTAKGMKALNKIVLARLKRLGIEASDVFFHPFRFKKDKTGQAYYSPHFHLLAAGWVDPGQVAAAFREDGWVLKVIRVIRTVEHLRMAAKYILTHVGTVEHVRKRDGDGPTPDGIAETRVQAYRLFGLLGYAKFGAASVLEAQKDVGGAIGKVLRSRSTGGKYPLIPKAYLDGAVAGAPAPPHLQIHARLSDRPDAFRVSDDGRVFTETRLDETHEVKTARIDKDVRSAADLRGLLKQLGAACYRAPQAAGRMDNPAFPPTNFDSGNGGGAAAEVEDDLAITADDVEPGTEETGGLPTVSQERIDEAQRKGQRLPPQRVLILRVDYYEPAAPAGAGGTPPSAVPYGPTKLRRSRYLTIILRPNLTDLCPICRRPMHILDMADDKPVPVDKWPQEETVLVDPNLIRRPDKDGPSYRIYADKDGAAAYDERRRADPVFLRQYPAHIQAALESKKARADMAYDILVQTGSRPTQAALDIAMERKVELRRARTPGLADNDDRRSHADRKYMP